MTASPPASVHPLNGAPDGVALAEFDAGRPDDAAAALASAHITRCVECQAVLSALRAVRDDVGRLSGGPMPPIVAGRIAAALAAVTAEPGAVGEHTTGAEQAGSGGVTAEPADEDQPADPNQGRHRAADVIELRSARRVQRLRVAAGLAAGVVLLGGGGYLLTNLTGGGGQDAASSAESGGDEAADDGAGMLAVPSYDRQSLEAAVGDLLTDNSVAASDGAGGGAPETVGGEERAGGGDVDQDCLASIPVATAEALTITRVVYEGQPAIVVLFAAAERGRVDVTVLSDCVEGTEPAVIDAFDAAR